MLLEEIWHYPIGDIPKSPSEEARQRLQRMNDLISELKSELTPNQRERLELFLSLSTEQGASESKASFLRGVKLCARFFAEALELPRLPK